MALFLYDTIVSTSKSYEIFCNSFFATFPEMKDQELWIAGESYAGIYSTYWADYQYQHGNPHNLKGVLVVDGVITDMIVQQDVVAYEFAVANRDLLKYTDDQLSTIKNMSDKSFSGPPNQPRSHRRGSKGLPRSRVTRRHPREMMYEKINAALDTETIAFIATTLPKLIATKTKEAPRQNSKELRGIGSPQTSRTCSSHSE